MSAPVLVELCAGTASVSLWALGRVRPLCGFMGSKRRFAALLADALGCDRPERVVLVDAGPWGEVWVTLSCESSRATVADVLDSWADEEVRALWERLVCEPPSVHPEARAAQYLWLQARSAGGIPLWWSAAAGRWESATGTGAGSVSAVRRTRGDPVASKGGDHARWGSGASTAALIARRIRALDGLPWDRVEVVHGDLRDLDPIPGAVVYIDPPYAGCPRYAALLPRADVLAVAARWAEVGCRVAVSEAEPLSELQGWHARRLPARKPEWVTASWPIAVPEQLGLWEAA